MRPASFIAGLLIALSLSASATAQERSFPEAHYGTNSEPVYSPQAAPASKEPAPSAAPAETKEQSKPAPQIIIYGRTSCGWTQHYMKALSAAKVLYTFKNIDDRTVNADLRRRMNAQGSLELPVIETESGISSRPDLETLLRTR